MKTSDGMLPSPVVAPPPPADAKPPPSFPRLPGETPRAFSAFLAFFQLGHARSLAAVAEKLGESPGTVKNWSGKFDWFERIHNFNSGLLHDLARDHAAAQGARAAVWNQRLNLFREQEWDAAQKLTAAARCFLESFGEAELQRMTLAQVSRALKISSTIARSALAGAELAVASDPEASPLQQQLLDGVARVYQRPPAPSISPDRQPLTSQP